VESIVLAVIDTDPSVLVVAGGFLGVLGLSDAGFSSASVSNAC
jgi:hypothetical protein